MRRREVLFFFSGGLALTACNTPVSLPVYPDITFQHKSPLRLDVSRIEVVESAATGAVELPQRDIRASLPVSPLAAMSNWASDRLVAAGGPGVARVSIIENKFVETPLDLTTGVQGIFTTDQSERYEGLMTVKIEILGDPMRSGFVQARAASKRTVPEDYTLNQREQTLYDMVASMTRALDERLEQEMRANMMVFLI